MQYIVEQTNKYAQHQVAKKCHAFHILLQDALNYIFFCEMLPLESIELNVQFFHFIDNLTVHEYQGPVKLFKICPTVQHLNKTKKFKICASKSSILLKMNHWLYGKTVCQYRPLKAPKFKIKSYELCESSTGCLVFHNLYRETHGILTKVKLQEQWLNCGTSSGSWSHTLSGWTVFIVLHS